MGSHGESLHGSIPSFPLLKSLKNNDPLVKTCLWERHTSMCFFAWSDSVSAGWGAGAGASGGTGRRRRLSSLTYELKWKMTTLVSLKDVVGSQKLTPEAVLWSSDQLRWSLHKGKWKAVSFSRSVIKMYFFVIIFLASLAQVLCALKLFCSKYKF